MVRSTTVKLVERVDLVQWYIAIFSSRLQGKRTTRDCRKGEGDPSVQLYNGSVLIAPWWYLCSAFVRRTILRQLSARSLETYLGANLSQYCA